MKRNIIIKIQTRDLPLPSCVWGPYDLNNVLHTFITHIWKYGYTAQKYESSNIKYGYTAAGGEWTRIIGFQAKRPGIRISAG
jgi:hypothetical protein